MLVAAAHLESMDRYLIYGGGTSQDIDIAEKDSQIKSHNHNLTLLALLKQVTLQKLQNPQAQETPQTQDSEHLEAVFDLLIQRMADLLEANQILQFLQLDSREKPRVPLSVVEELRQRLTEKEQQIDSLQPVLEQVSQEMQQLQDTNQAYLEENEMLTLKLNEALQRAKELEDAQKLMTKEFETAQARQNKEHQISIKEL